MMKNNLQQVLLASSLNVLETMFFADAEPAGEGVTHTDALACSLLSSGAETGAFTVAVDRPALQLLCEAFFGEEAPSAIRERELLCELTNMLAGSTLSAYAPNHYCPLSSPLLCDLDRHRSTATGDLHATATLLLDGGLLSVACALKSHDSVKAAA